jgi:hypothetical protein
MSNTVKRIEDQDGLALPLQCDKCGPWLYCAEIYWGKPGCALVLTDAAEGAP